MVSSRTVFQESSTCSSLTMAFIVRWRSGLSYRASTRERFVNDLGLFLLVALSRPGGGAGAFGASDVAELAFGRIQQRLDVLAQEAPRSHVARLFLRPY